ncbi:MAG: hypothetical protein ACJAXX_002097 [Roseivirga sp.]
MKFNSGIAFYQFTLNEAIHLKLIGINILIPHQSPDSKGSLYCGLEGKRPSEMT